LAQAEACGEGVPGGSECLAKGIIGHFPFVIFHFPFEERNTLELVLEEGSVAPALTNSVQHPETFFKWKMGNDQ
jgi:hypothetical protein